MVEQSRSKAAINSKCRRTHTSVPKLILRKLGKLHPLPLAVRKLFSRGSKVQLLGYNFHSPIDYPYCIDISRVLATRTHNTLLKFQVMHTFGAFEFAIFSLETGMTQLYGYWIIFCMWAQFD